MNNYRFSNWGVQETVGTHTLPIRGQGRGINHSLQSTVRFPLFLMHNLSLFRVGRFGDHQLHAAVFKRVLIVLKASRTA